MQGLWLENGRLSYRSDLPAPQPEAGEVLVRVRLAGVCGTDLELCKGYYPYTGILGHEFVGEVVSEDPRLALGQRVVGEINLTCGECRNCLKGRSHHCRTRTVLGIVGKDGCFADYLTLPRANLHPVSDSVSDRAAVFVEPLAAALRIRRQVDLASVSRILVLGVGRLGTLIAQVLSDSPGRLVAGVRGVSSQARLERLGIPASPIEELEERSFDLVVEATGEAAGFGLACRFVREEGTIVLKSTFEGKLEVDMAPLVVDEIRLVGSRCGSFPEALEWLESGRLDPTPLIEGIHGLQDGPAAFEASSQRGALKHLLIPGSGGHR